MLKQKTLLLEWTNTHPNRLSFRFSLVLLEKCPPANLTALELAGIHLSLAEHHQHALTLCDTVSGITALHSLLNPRRIIMELLRRNPVCARKGQRSRGWH